MSKPVSTALVVAVMVFVAGLILAGFPRDAYLLVVAIFAVCGGLITWIYMRTNDDATDRE